MSIDTFIRTLVAPPPEFSWAWALERPSSHPLSVHVVPELTSAARTPPREDELLLWFGVPEPRGRQIYFDYLGEEERLRAASFRFEADRWAFTAAHTGLRSLLGSMMACAPQTLRFAVGGKGKPYLDHEDQRAAVQFSMSHTRGCVGVAVARSAVGVDVERRRAIPDLMAVAKTAFAPEERAALVALSGSAARVDLFYRYWTLGEAFIKATGEGLAQDLTSFAFTEQGTPALTRVSTVWGPKERWRFHCEPR